jgi:hypothetical protein
MKGRFNMAAVAVIGDKLVDLNSLEAAVDERGDALDEFLVNPELDLEFGMNVTGGVVLNYSDLARARMAASEIVPFQEIGLGKPLTVILESVYVGDYPDTFKWVRGKNRSGVLVTSSHKAFQNFNAAPRAVHLLKERAERREHLNADAPNQGSQLLYYTPAVTNTSTLFTVEVSVDRDFSAKVATDLGKAFLAAGALPVFATAAPYLVAAGVAIPTAAKTVSLLANPHTYYVETVRVNFGLAGMERAQARALVLYPGDDERLFAGYKLSQDNILCDGDNNPYKGELPYAVVSLDGTEHSEFEGWTAHAAAAVLLDRFFQAAGRPSNAMHLVTEAMSLYNDIEFQKRAATEWKAASETTGDAKEKHEEMARAYVKNIQNETIRKIVYSAET